MNRVVLRLAAIALFPLAVAAAEAPARPEVQHEIDQLVRAITTTERAGDEAAFVARADRLQQI
ncbi:MAG TPA: hypothetical protein VD788_11180, partial [Candidatus Polarisedimenticolaceae bacterium]|nr:hypothetical protein [Candidatus Polarisedimenticolaceae bacterium]